MHGVASTLRDVDEYTFNTKDEFQSSARASAGKWLGIAAYSAVRGKEKTADGARLLFVCVAWRQVWSVVYVRIAYVCACG